MPVLMTDEALVFPVLIYRCCPSARPGRMNMRAVEVTVQNLVGSGMNPKTENDPYLGFVYTSFQERATKVGPVLVRHGRPPINACPS